MADRRQQHGRPLRPRGHRRGRSRSPSPRRAVPRRTRPIACPVTVGQRFASLAGPGITGSPPFLVPDHDLQFGALPTHRCPSRAAGGPIGQGPAAVVNQLAVLILFGAPPQPADRLLAATREGRRERVRRQSIEGLGEHLGGALRAVQGDEVASVRFTRCLPETAGYSGDPHGHEQGDPHRHDGPYAVQPSPSADATRSVRTRVCHPAFQARDGSGEGLGNSPTVTTRWRRLSHGPAPSDVEASHGRRCPAAARRRSGTGASVPDVSTHHRHHRVRHTPPGDSRSRSDVKRDAYRHCPGTLYGS